MYSKEFVTELYGLIDSKDKTIAELRNELRIAMEANELLRLTVASLEAEIQRLYDEITKDT